MMAGPFPGPSSSPVSNAPSFNRLPQRQSPRQPKNMATSLDLRGPQEHYASRDPMQASRHMRSYSQENLSHGGNPGNSVGDIGLYTPRSRPVANGARRTVSWSNVPRGMSSNFTSRATSRATTPRSAPGIPWGQIPGMSGTRGGTISPIDSEGCASPTSMLPKGYDYVKRAKLITKVLFSEAARLSRSFALCFNYSMPDSATVSPRIGPNIRPRLGTTDVFDVHLVLRPPIPSEAFEIMSTLPRDITPGYAVAKLNPNLSPAEKVNVKRTWGPLLLAEEYLTPALVSQCISDAIQKAVTSLDKIHIGRDLYSVIPACSPPQLTLMVSYINLDTTSDFGNSSFTINISPVIIAAGIPRISGFQLRMPIPHVLPYSRVGLEIMREFDEEVQDWVLFWRLEGRYVQEKKKPAVPGFLQGVITKRTRLKKEQLQQEVNGPLPLQTHLRAWAISFEPLEDRLLELCLKREFFAQAKDAFHLFDEMVLEFGEAWAFFPPSLTTSLKLWTIYKTAIKNRTVLDWLSSLLHTIYESLRQRSCAYFLLPRINMLRHIEKKHVDSLKKQLQELLKKKPTSTGALKPSSTESSKPTSPGSSKTTSTGASKVTSTGASKATSTGASKTTNTGASKTTSTGPSKATSTGASKTTSTGASKPTYTGVKRSHTIHF